MSSAPTVSVREWTDVVRRARLGKTTKYVALMLATFADYTDGTRIYPGLATLAHAAEVDYKTAQKAVAQLIAAGLIEVVNDRSGIRERGTEYRLVLLDVLDRIAVENPAEFKLGAERVGMARRRSGRTTRGVGRPDPEGHPTGRGVPTEQPEEGRPTGRAPKPEGRPTPRRRDAPPHATRTSIDQDTTTNPHPMADLDTAVTGSRASPPEDSKISKCVVVGCAKGFVLSTDGTSIERCLDPSHPPPNNVIQFPSKTA